MQSPPTVELVAPGDGAPLRRDGQAYVAPDGRRYAIEDGIVRTLGAVDPLLAAEIASQDQALSVYVDPKSLMIRYERTVARLAVEGLLPDRRGPILDVGCGVGLVGSLYPELDLYGVDVSMTLLRQARMGYRMRIEGSAESLPFPEGSFSAILAINMLHHVISPERALVEFARVLAPGGVLVAIDPRKVGPVELVKKLLRRNDKAFAATHKAFAVDEYRNLVSRDGLRSDVLQRFGLVTTLTAGGLDQLKLSRFVPEHDRFLGVLMGIDRVLERLPVLDRAGLYLAVRARS